MKLASKKKIVTGPIGSVSLEEMDFAELLDKEWLLTNSRGGFSCGTVAGCNTRRYHGLLTGALNPPAKRIMALSTFRETAEIDGTEIELSNFEFAEETSARGFKRMFEFHKDLGVCFQYDLGIAEMTKSIYLLPDADVVMIAYEITSICQEFHLTVRPLVAMRDFHSLQKSNTTMASMALDNGFIISAPLGDPCELFVGSKEMDFRQDEQWWYNFLYRVERQRGQDYLEDLFSPGVFTCHVDSPCRVVIWASLSASQAVDDAADIDLTTAIDSIMLREDEVLGDTVSNDEIMLRLYSAAGQFVVERDMVEGKATTILAGFPWFLDWGRDTFISLPGLLLCTERFREAANVLTTYAGAISEGMIPNRFDDYSQQAHYNSIDASLWFVHAAFEYLRTSGDTQTFSVQLLPAIRWIIDSYSKGTRFGIHADADALITGGDPNTQLTWMDAKCNGKSFTPRHGKAVEINALWYSALGNLALYYKNKGKDQNTIEAMEFYARTAEKVRGNFCELFWNDRKGYLNDCIGPSGTVDDSLRPNQIYAVSLPFSPLSTDQQRKVLEAVDTQLRTPYGLRTLAPNDPRYIGRYHGEQTSRDSAYHNGTVWPYLIGAFIEAYLKVNSFDKQSKRKAMRYLRPLLSHMANDACIGSISEIFDGDSPHKPRGCFAQAWSVAEVLRSYKLLLS